MPPGPWDHRAPEASNGFYVWIVLIAALCLVLWQLSVLLPDQQRTTWDYALMLRNLIVIMAATGGLIFMRRIAFGARPDILVWTGIIAFWSWHTPIG